MYVPVHKKLASGCCLYNWTERGLAPIGKRLKLSLLTRLAVLNATAYISDENNVARNERDASGSEEIVTVKNVQTTMSGKLGNSGLRYRWELSISGLRRDDNE